MSHGRQSGRTGPNNSGGQRRRNNPRQAGLYQQPPEYQHMPAAPSFQQNMYPMPMNAFEQQSAPFPYSAGGPFQQNLQDVNSGYQQPNFHQTPRSRAFMSNNQPPRRASPAPPTVVPLADAPPSYDQVYASSNKNSRQPIPNSNITQNIDRHPKDLLNLNIPKPENIPAHWNPDHGDDGEKVSRSHKSVRGAQERGNTRGRSRGARGATRGRGRGAHGPTKGRGGLGGLNGGRLSSFATRGRRRPALDADRKSEVTVSSVGTERDDLSVEVQRQLISELDFPSVDKDPTAVLIELMNGVIDFHPYALKNFLEYCTGGNPRVRTMVVASDKQSAVAIFEGDIDCEELEMFVTEPQNQFLGYDLDFEEVDELSAAIVFTDDDITDYINNELEPRLTGIKDHIRDHRQSDDIAVISFQGLSQNDLWHLMKTDMGEDIGLFPLYPYPSPEYMHVVRESYFYFNNQVDSPTTEQDCTLLLSQVDDTLSDKEIKKVMTVEKFSGGDSTAKVHASPYGIAQQRLITYSKPEVCLRVMNRSPIKMMTDGRIVGYPAMRADVVVENADSLSRHFLLLTGVRTPTGDENVELTKHILQYFCANYARHTVQQVYFTRDGKCAVVMFSADIAARDPDFAALQNAFMNMSDDPIAATDVWCWRLLPVSHVTISGIQGKVSEVVKSGVQKCKQEFDIDVNIENVAPSKATLKFNDEKGVVKFLNRVTKQCSFGDTCMEFPVIGPLAEHRLYSERLDSLIPPTLSLSAVVEDLGFSTEYLEYVKQSGDKKLVKLFNKCHTFWHRSLHELRIDQQILDKTDVDIVKLLKEWASNVKDALEAFLNGLRLMDEKRVVKADWLKVEKKKPSALYVMKEFAGTKHVKVKAIGSESDVDSLQQMLASVKLDESSSTEQITMSVTDANYIKFHYLDALRQAYLGPTINISLGSELSTLVIQGNAAEVTAVKQVVEEYIGTLKSRKMTIASPQWQFLNSRKSRAYLHFNGGELKTLGVQYWCTQKGTRQLVMLTATSTDDLSQAENILRREVVVEKYEIKSQQEWKEYTKPVIETLFQGSGYPLHLIEPDEGAATVTIVTAKLAEGILKELLSAAKGEKTATVASAPKTKTKKSKKKAEKVGGSSTPPVISDMSFGAIPKRSSQPILDSPIFFGGGRVGSPIPIMDVDLNSAHVLSSWPADTPGHLFSEEVKLSMNHQYIEYQFLSHYCHQVLDEESSDVTMDERTVTIRSSSAEEAKRVKNRLLKLIQHKLNKETREVRNGVDEKVFENAARDLTLWFLINSSKQLLDYTIGNVSVVACKPSIQCIKADAVIIAVKNDLYMNQSGVGAVLAIADPKASKELRSRYDSDNLDSAGSCQELERYDLSTLYRLYQVIVVDPKDKNSLRMGFSNALRRCESLNITSVVTNLLGSDMKGFVSDKESASILLSCISEHVRCLEKTRLQTVYMCETNERKVDTLVSEIKKYGRGVQFVDSSLPQAGSTMVSICSHTKKDGDEFFRRCAHHLA